MLGTSGRSASAGGLDDFSVVLFFWRLKGETANEKEGKMEMVLSMGGLCEDPRVFAGPTLPH